MQGLLAETVFWKKAKERAEICRLGRVSRKNKTRSHLVRPCFCFALLYQVGVGFDEPKQGAHHRMCARRHCPHASHGGIFFYGAGFRGVRRYPNREDDSNMETLSAREEAEANITSASSLRRSDNGAALPEQGPRNPDRPPPRRPFRQTSKSAPGGIVRRTPSRHRRRSRKGGSGNRRACPTGARRPRGRDPTCRGTRGHGSL